jgi:O-antigen ligase
MNRENIDLWLERGIGMLVLCLLVFSQLAFGAEPTGYYLIAVGIVVLANVLWLLRLWISPQPRIFFHPACWTVLGFTIYAFMRLPFANVFNIARLETMQILVYAMLFYVVINNLQRQELTRMVVLALVFLGVAVAVYGLYQYFSEDNKIWNYLKQPQYGKRATGTFFRPTNLSAFLEMILPLGITFTFLKRFGHATRIVLVYSAIVMLVGIGATFARMGWIAAASGVIMLFLVLGRERRLRWLFLACSILLLIGAYVFINKSDKNMQRRFSDMVETGVNRDLRYRLWPVAVKIWLKEPWVGVGAGHFDCYYPPYREPIIRSQNQPQYAHSDILNTLADYGLVGAILVLATFVLIFSWAWKTWAISSQSNSGSSVLKDQNSVFVLGATCGLFAILVHSIGDFNLHIPSLAMLMVVLMAMIASHVRHVTPNFLFTVGTKGRILATVALSFAIFVIVQHSEMLRQESFWLRQSSKATTFEAQLACLEKAHAANPENDWTAYKIGESCRLRSFEGLSGFEELTDKAMIWLRKAMDLNPFQSLYPLRFGMCLDWGKKYGAAEVFFKHALKLDPNSYHTNALMGWHCYQTERYEAALAWLEKSMGMKQFDNPMAVTYWHLTRRKLAEAAVDKTARNKLQ